ncbi:1,4-dihydroxy-2-naphthoate polyprenyltransferase [Desulfocastanea catecholica]
MQETVSSKIGLWLLAIRPKTLPAAVGPVAVGSAVAFADGKFSLLPAFCCLLGAVLLQIGVNLANDYFDYKNNIDSKERLGPVRVTQSGLISPCAVKRGMIVCLVLAAMVFLYLALVGGWPIVLIGAASVLGALAYSGGPYPLASHGLGELFVFIFFGLVAVGGTYLVQAGQLTWMVMLAAVPPGLLITSIMVVNNLRDIDTDRKAGKKTLAVILGRSRTIAEYKLLLILSYLVPLAMISAGMATIMIVLPLLTLPLAWVSTKRISDEKGASLNDLLAVTAKLSLLYSLLFAVGLAL